MKPTNNLRFDNRTALQGNIFKNKPSRTLQLKILQQWWAHDPDCYEDFVMRVNGEWRDVPIEDDE